MPCIPLSPSCLSSAWACGGADLPCRRAVWLGLSLVARSPCRLAKRRSGWLLACVPRLVAQCGRRGGSLVSLLAWMGLAWKYGDYVNCRFSVDYLVEGGYINTRAWMLFSPFFVSWHVLLCGRLSCGSLSPTSLSSSPQQIGSSGARRERFFYQSSSHPIPSLGCLLTCGLLLPGYHHIHIAPLPSPLPSTRRTGRA